MGETPNLTISEFVDRWRPITRSCGLLHVPQDEAVRTFLDWKGGHDHDARVRIDTGPVPGEALESFATVEPLSAGAWRHLFLPVKGDAWTVVVNSNMTGTDVHSLTTSFSRMYGIETINVLLQPHTYDTKTNKGRWGGFTFHLHHSDGTDRIVRLLRDHSGWDFLEPSEPGFAHRLVQLLRGHAGWEFLAEGEPLPFEQLGRYTARRKIDRFNGEVLLQYLDAMGLRPFDEGFYDHDRQAVLFNEIVTGEVANGWTLQQVRAGAEDMDVPRTKFSDD